MCKKERERVCKKERENENVEFDISKTLYVSFGGITFYRIRV